MKRIFVFLTFLMCGTSTFAQNNFLWQTLFGGEQYNGLKPNECPEELPSGVVSLKDGSYVVVGSSNDCSKLDTNSKIEQKNTAPLGPQRSILSGIRFGGDIFLRVNRWIWKVIRSMFTTMIVFGERILSQLKTEVLSPLDRLEVELIIERSFFRNTTTGET
ncbi:hypothetical protein LEP1GSC062_2642 [Leptospira alexanderi serovar Manhao 3 str. L 60]|uniref:Uncharacterized protein n=1 Tax=Leptospira alexanderi serovar Manhao 3 str. L 60 TaxID=1049759 RepID=V6HUX8_9LEPT|nr:hypothetical protein LEP1GSC062_2642 [Leptospira alexanderi serovar Manhao 3 str. L 60]